MVLDIQQFVPLDEAESYLLCLNQNTWLLVQMLHSFYGSWRNRYTQDSEVEEPLQPTDEQFRLALDTFDQGEMELSQVTCLTDIVDAINALTEATIAQSVVLNNLVTVTGGGGGPGGNGGNGGGCGGCSGGIGTVLPFPGIDGQPSGGGGPGGNGLPTTYSGTLEQYSVYKCKAANWVFDTVVRTLRYLGGLNSVVAGVGAGEAFAEWLIPTIAAASFFDIETGLVFALLAGWQVVLIVAAVATVTLVAGVAVLSVSLSLADEIDSRKTSDVICGLYDAQDAAAARAILAPVIADSVASFVISPPFDDFDTDIRAMLTTITGYFLPDVLFSSLFSNAAKFSALEDYVSDNPVDCTDCDTAGEFFSLIEEFNLGSFVSAQDANPLVIEGTEASGWACGTDARELAVTVAAPVTITAIARANAPSAGECGSVPIFHWFANPDLTSPIYEGSGLPQTDGPHVGVRSFWILVDSDGETPEWTITYTVD